MDPMTIALICAASLGAVVALSAFVRQLILSRDKNLNDEAQRKALDQEALELQKMREQMQSNQRFDSHYRVISANKDAIIYLDTKIEDIFHKKSQMVERYAQVSLKESGAIVDGAGSAERKAACDRLKQEIDEEIKFYDRELIHLQQRRASLWDTHADLQEYLLNQEKARNANLDLLYKRHSGMLEKIYIRHTDDSEHIAKQSIDAGTASFKMIILAPIQFLLQYFNISSGISLGKPDLEQQARDDVDKAEKDVNDEGQYEDGMEYPDDATPPIDEVNDDFESDDEDDVFEDAKDDIEDKAPEPEINTMFA